MLPTNRWHDMGGFAEDGVVTWRYIQCVPWAPSEITRQLVDTADQLGITWRASMSYWEWVEVDGQVVHCSVLVQVRGRVLPNADVYVDWYGQGTTTGEALAALAASRPHLSIWGLRPVSAGHGWKKRAATVAQQLYERVRPLAEALRAAYQVVNVRLRRRQQAADYLLNPHLVWRVQDGKLVFVEVYS